MTRLVSLLSGGVMLCSSLVAGVMSAAAQPSGACSLISDDALSQAVGSSVHAVGLMSNPDAESAGAPAIADMCIAQLGGQNGLVITHMVSVQSPGDLNSALSMSQAGPGAALANIDPSLLTITPVSGLGDSAVLLNSNQDSQPFAVLVVWRGTEGFSLLSSGLSDPQTSLQGVAEAILGAQP